MRASKAIFILIVALTGVLASDWSLAHGRGRGGSHFAGHSGRHFTDGERHFHRSHVFIGGAFVGGYGFWPWWDVAPYYPAVGVSGPVVYIEKGDDPESPRQQWLYCRSANAYYPYVADCAEGWEFVPVQPAGVAN